MAWTDSAMIESWRTSNFRGYVAGYGFTLMDELPAKGKKESKNDTSIKPKSTIGRLFIGHLPKSGSLADLIPGGAETEMIVYDLEFSHEKIKK